MPTQFSFNALASGVLLFTSGCMTIGPDYEPATLPIESDWVDYEDPAFHQASSPVELEWWHAAFNDSALDRLIREALDDNLSLRAAGLRVLQARQQLQITLGNRYPQTQALSGQAGVGGVASSPAYEVYDFGFDVSWEADVWGRFQRQIESASALLDASVATYDGVMVSLIAEVAQTYLSIRTTQQRLEVAKANLVLQKEGLNIATAKVDEGEVSPLDVEQARTLYYTTQAAEVALEQTLLQLKNSLAILLGRSPQSMDGLLDSVEPIPEVPAELAIGMPQDLIRRRPDLRIAERQLAAQSAQIGFAMTELYPHFGIGGTIHTDVTTQGTLDFDDLFRSETMSYSLLGTFQWNIFNYGRLKNNVRLQDASFQQQLEAYRQSVLQAQGEVENAIVAFFKSKEQLLAFQQAEAAAERAATISMDQYMEGLVEFDTAINTLTALVRQQDQLMAAEGTVAANLVSVYEAIGGGWEVDPSRELLDVVPEPVRIEMKSRGKYWDESFDK